MPHKVNPIRFENAKANLEISSALLDTLGATLVTSRMQRDLTDSTTQRNIGPAFGHSLLAIDNVRRGLAGLDVNADAMARDLDANWEVLGEAVQSAIRAAGVAGVPGMDNPYERLKDLTRGRRITGEDLREFVLGLGLPDPVAQRLAAMTPATTRGPPRTWCGSWTDHLQTSDRRRVGRRLRAGDVEAQEHRRRRLEVGGPAEPRQRPRAVHGLVQQGGGELPQGALDLDVVRVAGRDLEERRLDVCPHRPHRWCRLALGQRGQQPGGLGLDDDPAFLDGGREPGRGVAPHRGEVDQADARELGDGRVDVAAQREVDEDARAATAGPGPRPPPRRSPAPGCTRGDHQVGHAGRHRRLGRHRLQPPRGRERRGPTRRGVHRDAPTPRSRSAASSPRRSEPVPTSSTRAPAAGAAPRPGPARPRPPNGPRRPAPSAPDSPRHPGGGLEERLQGGGRRAPGERAPGPGAPDRHLPLAEDHRVEPRGTVNRCWTVRRAPRAAGAARPRRPAPVAAATASSQPGAQRHGVVGRRPGTPRTGCRSPARPQPGRRGGHDHGRPCEHRR